MTVVAAGRGRVISPLVGSAAHSKGYWRESWDRLLEDRGGIVAGMVLILMVLVAALAPVLSALVTHVSYSRQDLDNTFLPPGRTHLLGTDEIGRDTLTRLLFGGQVTFEVAFLTVLMLLFVGTTVGVVAGFFGGWIDQLLMRAVDMLLSIPTIFLLILLSILEPFHLSPHTPGSLAVIIAVISWGPLARLTRAETLAVKERDFMIAARSLGAGPLRLMLRHLLPNILAVIVVTATLAIGQVILVEAAIDFVGLGIRAPIPSWGNMLFNAQGYFTHSWWLVLLPGATIFITVMSANIFGNALRDALDPRLR